MCNHACGRLPGSAVAKPEGIPFPQKYYLLYAYIELRWSLFARRLFSAAAVQRQCHCAGHVRDGAAHFCGVRLLESLDTTTPCHLLLCMTAAGTPFVRQHLQWPASCSRLPGNGILGKAHLLPCVCIRCLPCLYFDTKSAGICLLVLIAMTCSRPSHRNVAGCESDVGITTTLAYLLLPCALPPEASLISCGPPCIDTALESFSGQRDRLSA